jgi:2-dehydro-3-deoxygluconokinase
MQKIVSFGEVMMRLTPPGNQRLIQATSLNILFAGAEANVTSALSGWKLNGCHVTRFPDNTPGLAAIAWLKHCGINTEYIQMGGDRLGLFFVENGAMARPTAITYDRLPSAFSTIEKNTFDWNAILDDADWFHWTGITPALSQGAADSLAAALSVCERNNIKVSADVNYRSNLWKYGKTPGEILEPLVARSNVIVGSENDTRNIFGFGAEQGAENVFVSISSQLMKKFSSIKAVISSNREQRSASHNRFTGNVWDGQQLWQTKTYDLEQIVERIGTGDAFIAGYIYGQLQNWDIQDSIDFATAAAVLKHSVEGDVIFCSVEEVQEITKGNTSGRIKR